MLSEHNKFLENAYMVLNRVYFEDSLPEAVITIQSSQRAYGHITVGKVWQDSWDSYHEINISAEYLNRPVENIIATLLHECCHLFALEVLHIKDTSNNYRYHNKKFKEIAEARDLKISYHESIGWSLTEPTEKLIETIKKYHLDTQLEYVRVGAYGMSGGDDNGADGGNGLTGTNGKKPKKKSSTRKYICPVCHNSVRATKNVNILCMDCNKQMQKEE